MDNVADAALLHDEKILHGPTPLSLGCNVLFTTRDRLALADVMIYNLSTLDEVAAMTLLTSTRPPEPAQRQSAATEICRAVGGLPLGGLFL